MPHPETTAVADDLLPAATRRLVRTVDSLADSEYAGASGLPAWSRAHVLAHLALNAEGLAGVLHGILEGRPRPMYASQEARDADIEELATADPSEIRSRLLAGGTALADAIAAVPEDRWDTRVDRVPGGPTFRVAAIPEMRLREVEIHHADLDAGYGPGSWDPAFSVRLLEAMGRRDLAATPFTAHATDLDRRWPYGEGGPVVSGAAADLGWWLTGRGSGEGLTSDDGRLPRIGAW